MRNPLLIVLGVLAASLTVSGCSGSGSGAEAGGSPDAAAAVPQGVASMYRTVEEEIDEAGGATTTGEWRVGYVVEAAEPWFEHGGGHHDFRAPAPGETHHIEIIPIEKSTGRIMPTVPIHVEVLAEDGTVVDKKDLNFYYAEFFHYANNFEVPDSGTYRIRATLSAPTFKRHGEAEEGPALAKGATVTFDDVELGAQ